MQRALIGHVCVCVCVVCVLLYQDYIFTFSLYKQDHSMVITQVRVSVNV